MRCEGNFDCWKAMKSPVPAFGPKDEQGCFVQHGSQVDGWDYSVHFGIQTSPADGLQAHLLGSL